MNSQEFIASLLQNVIVTSIITALTTAFITNFLYWRRVKADLQKDYENKFNERKWTVYSDIIRFYSEIIRNKRPASAKMDESATELLLIAPDSVIQAFNQLSYHIGKHVNNPELTVHDAKRGIALLMNMILTMRKDLGNRSGIRLDDLSDLADYRTIITGK